MVFAAAGVVLLALLGCVFSVMLVGFAASLQAPTSPRPTAAAAVTWVHEVDALRRSPPSADAQPRAIGPWKRVTYRSESNGWLVVLDGPDCNDTDLETSYVGTRNKRILREITGGPMKGAYANFPTMGDRMMSRCVVYIASKGYAEANWL